MRFDSHIFAFVALSALLSVSLQQSCGDEYAQCGGLLYTGPTCCKTGYVCAKQNDYYSQCLLSSDPGASNVPSVLEPISATLAVSTKSTPYRTSTTFLSGEASATHTQGAYPTAGAGGCSGQAMVDGACCPVYCSNNNRSEQCSSGCTGSCVTPDASVCKSGTMWSEVKNVTNEEAWHYSRSTHYGITSAGACGFGLYGMCTQSKEMWVGTMLDDACNSFCKAYPSLCQDPAGNVTLRGNFAAPNGDYYTQFWNSLPGDRDNYLSCGECFQVVRTKTDGTDYAMGEAGYTDPIVLEITDSCPCWPNPKWCCGSGADHCGEIDFKYGCPIPKDSIHLDLSDIAMGRLQGNGNIVEGVIPTRYKRVPCPKPGNVYIWLHPSAGPYYFQVTAVNVASSTGSIVNMEVRGAGQKEWIALVQQPDYSSSRPQERYGAWQIQKDSGPYALPVGMRLTAATGEQIVNEVFITSFTEPSTIPAGWWYLDMELQFTE